MKDREPEKAVPKPGSIELIYHYWQHIMLARGAPQHATRSAFNTAYNEWIEAKADHHLTIRSCIISANAHMDVQGRMAAQRTVEQMEESSAPPSEIFARKLDTLAKSFRDGEDKAALLGAAALLDQQRRTIQHYFNMNAGIQPSKDKAVKLAEALRYLAKHSLSQPSSISTANEAAEELLAQDRELRAFRAFGPKGEPQPPDSLDLPPKFTGGQIDKAILRMRELADSAPALKGVMQMVIEILFDYLAISKTRAMPEARQQLLATIAAKPVDKSTENVTFKIKLKQ